jgi:hypothetical protein
MKIIKFGSASLLAVSLVWLGGGCSTIPTEPQNPPQLQIDGLTLSAYPLASKKEVKQVFKVNLLDRGVLPIRLKAENRSPSTSFIIAKDKVVVMNETTRATNAPGQAGKDFATWSQSKKVGTKLGAGVATGSPVLLLVIAMTPTPSEFVFKPDEERLTGREFVTRTLGPGQTADGFIYFRYSNPISPTNAYHVVSEVKNLSTGEMVPFDLKLDLNPNSP